MKSKSSLKLRRIPRNYQGLVLMFMPRAIHDKVDYDITLEVIDALAGHDLTDEQELYLDTLSTLVESYEDEHHAIRSANLSPLQALRFLVSENGMTPADLGKLLGERTLGSKILLGQRPIGLTYARILAKHFRTDIGLFIA